MITYTIFGYFLLFLERQLLKEKSGNKIIINLKQSSNHQLQFTGL